MNMFVQSNYKFTTQAMMHFKVHSSFLFFLSPVISLPLFTIYSQANEATETEKDKNVDIKIVIKGKKKKKRMETNRRRQAGGANKDKLSKRLKLSKTNQERGRHEDTVTCSRPLNGSSLWTAGWTGNILSYLPPI